ncbi:MAG: DMP19 family protein [Rickettsia endosymbiont of Ecitomorpha arachnoides]|nr:DMP19 family protein [Rickettsia endosymbiont of Ecitomorpha arachnoides]
MKNYYQFNLKKLFYKLLLVIVIIYLAIQTYNYMDKLKTPTLIKYSDFYNEDKYERIQGVIDYVNALRNGLYNQEELDQKIPQAQQVYFVDYYLSQVENGGLTQYFSNSNFNEEQNNIVLKGLENIKAHKNKEIFFQACQLLSDMVSELREEYLFSDMYQEEEVRQKPMIKEVHAELEKLTDLFFEINENEESIFDLNFKYIEKIDNLKIVDDNLYDEELEAILDLVPAYDERKTYAFVQWLKNMPRYTKIARRLCSKYNLKLSSVNSLSYGEEFVGEEQVKKIMIMVLYFII